jgi:hypothetical protein
MSPGESPPSIPSPKLFPNECDNSSDPTKFNINNIMSSTLSPSFLLPSNTFSAASPIKLDPDGIIKNDPEDNDNNTSTSPTTRNQIIVSIDANLVPKLELRDFDVDEPHDHNLSPVSSPQKSLFTSSTSSPVKVSGTSAPLLTTALTTPTKNPTLATNESGVGTSASSSSHEGSSGTMGSLLGKFSLTSWLRR